MQSADGGDAMDYVYGKKYLESLSYVDSSRIGVWGGSYGGYMTYILLSKYAEYGWAAGAALYGITDWKTVYDEYPIDYRLFFESLLGKYEEHTGLWEDRSPLTHAEKVRALLVRTCDNLPDQSIGSQSGEGMAWLRVAVHGQNSLGI